MHNKAGIFISTPISGFESEEEYLGYRKIVLSLIERLRSSFNVCSEIEQITGVNTYDSPSKSIQDDLYSIQNNDVFLFLHPFKTQSSSLIELGYAIALNKKIVIVGSRKDLPYLAIGIDSYSPSAIIVDVKELSFAHFDQIYTAVVSVLEN